MHIENTMSKFSNKEKERLFTMRFLANKQSEQMFWKNLELEKFYKNGKIFQCMNMHFHSVK